MKKNITILSAFMLLCACTTQETILKNSKTGQVARCGGEVAYAGILYPFMLESAKQCVASYNRQGFVDVNTPIKSDDSE